MQSFQLPSVPRPLPDGISATATDRGVLVIIEPEKVSILNLSIWRTGLIFAVFIFTIFSIFFASFGAWKMIPGVFVMAAIVGLVRASYAQTEFSRRRSLPAKLELTGDNLIIEEPGFEYQNAFIGKRVNVTTGHIEYALSDLNGFSVRTFLGGSLRVRLSIGASIDHLKQRPIDQLRWTCSWLSGACGARHRLAAPQTPKALDSFVYKADGPHSH